MAKLTYSQKSALNVLDLLFFRDVESLSSFRDGKNLFYADFLGEINRVNLERNHQGGRAELYTHYLLCGIEMKFSVLYPRDDVEQSELISSSKFVFNTLRNEIVKHGFLSDEFNWDISDLFEAYKNHPNLDRGVVSSLVRDCLYFDFDSSAVVVYKKFLDLKIVKTEKYDSSKSKIDIDLLERAFLRSMLFIEFEVLKKQFHIKKIMEIRTIEIDLSLSLAEIEDEFKALISMKKSILLLEENFDHIYDINIKNKVSVERYLINIVERFDHEAIFLKNISACNGLIGCWFLMSFKETDLSRPWHYEQFSEFMKAKTKETCAIGASKLLNQYGFDVEPRTFYKHYINFYPYYDRIRNYSRS